MKGRKRGEFGGKKGREKAVLTVEDLVLVGKICGGVTLAGMVSGGGKSLSIYRPSLQSDGGGAKIFCHSEINPYLCNSKIMRMDGMTTNGQKAV